ncbi:MAG: hypothetical protein CMJ58_26595 [Planctomycetaceae bacterium]|nr:hypothetical protein [Planctomycetaceae bacterium]
MLAAAIRGAAGGMNVSAAQLERFLASALASQLLPAGAVARALAGIAGSATPSCDCDVVLQTVKRTLIEEGNLTAWQSEKLELDKFRGFYVGDYVLLDHVTSDAATVTYLAKHAKDGRRFHLKVTNPHPLKYEVEPLAN